MRLQLVDNLVMPETGQLEFLDVHPHLGLISLATIVSQFGHTVSIYDPKRKVKTGQLPYNRAIYETVARELMKASPDVVGFTTLGCSFVFASNVAQELKNIEPEIPILLGGPHATMLHHQILQAFPQFDVIVRYEAEETLPQVMERVSNLTFDGIPGVTWRVMGRIHESSGMPRIDELDTLPIPSYEYYPVKDLDLDLLRIEAGRGCPFSCTFCSTALFFQRKFRLKSASRLVKELDILHQEYGYSDFKLDHDLFTVNKHLVREYCDAVRGRGYRWRVSARVDCVDEALLENMADAGCVGLYFGIETGSERMQKISQKRLDLDLIDPMLDTTERLGIEVTVSFITGYPQELQEDQDATLDLLGHCFDRQSKLLVPQLHILSPEPGTPLFSDLGESLQYDGYSTKFNAALFGELDQRLVLEHPDIFPNYFYYPTVTPREHHTLAVDVLDIFRTLGATVTSYLLRFFEGRLSNLVAVLRAWACTRTGMVRINTQLFEDYIQHKFGKDHHVTSLVRYALALEKLCADMSNDVPVNSLDSGFQPEAYYCLSKHALLMSDIHDVGSLTCKLKNLPRGATLDNMQAGGLVFSLTVVNNGILYSYIIESGVHTILELFQTSRRAEDVLALLGDYARDRIVEEDLFEALINIGALTRECTA